MMETYRARSAIRDVGAALGLPPDEIDVIAKAFPHIRARSIQRRPGRAARAARQRAGHPAADRMFRARRAARRAAPARRHAPVRGGAVRHLAAGPDPGGARASSGLPDEPVRQGRRRDRRAAQARRARHPDAVGDGVRGGRGGADPAASRSTSTTVGCRATSATFQLIRRAQTLGCFQIESPGQRELVGKCAPETFDDLIIDISLFRPGPVKSDMVTPFLRDPARLARGQLPARGPGGQRWPRPAGWSSSTSRCCSIIPAMTGCGLAEADEVRRALGSTEQAQDAGRGVVRAAGPGPGLRRRRPSSGSGRCSRRSARSASARRTRRRSPCRPTSRPG